MNHWNLRADQYYMKKDKGALRRLLRTCRMYQQRLLALVLHSPRKSMCITQNHMTMCMCTCTCISSKGLDTFGSVAKLAQ